MADFYVATTGNNGNSGTIGSPFLTINHGLAQLNASDALYIRGGSYDERIDVGVINIPGGSAWSNATLVSGYPSETVIIKPLTPGGGLLNLPRPDQTSGQINEWIIWQDLVFDGTNVDGGGIIYCGQSHNRFLRCEVKNNGAGGSNINVSAAVTIGGQAGAPVIGVEFSHGSVHDNSLISGVQSGINAPYGFYVSRSTGCLIEYSQIYRNGGYGIHGYSSAGDHQRSTFRFNTLWDNQLFATNIDDAHILSSMGDFHQVISNLIFQTTGTPPLSGISVQNSSGTLVAKNTIVKMPRTGIQLASGSFQTQVIDNIVIDSDQTSIGFLNIEDSGVGNFFSKNLCRGSGGTAHAEFTFDPLFVNPGTNDYHLQAGSPAIDVGEIVSGVAYFGSLPDLGALEFGSEDLPIINVDPIPPQPPGGGGTIDYDSDGDSVDIPGVGEGLPPSGTVLIPLGQILITVIAYNVNGSSIITTLVRTFAGGLTYRAAAGYAPRSIKGGADLSVDNSELVGIMANKAIANAMGFLIKGVLTDEDIEVGRFDFARDELFVVNYEELSQGKMYLPSSGSIGQIKSKRGTYEAETRGKQFFLQQTFGDLISKLCRARLGDDVGDGTGEHDYKKQGYGCRVKLDPPFWRAETAYTVRLENDAATGSVVKPQTYNGRHFECITAGTSGFYEVPQQEPAWNLQVGASTTDGGVTWRTILALEVFGSVTGAINRRFFQDDARYEPPTTGIGINTDVAQFGILDVNLGGNYFEVEGELTGVFVTSTTFQVNGSIANDGTYTVSTSSFVDGRTRIVVVETIPDNRAGGTVGAPNALATGFFTFGKLTWLTGLNQGISSEVKQFTLAEYDLVDVDTGGQIFMLDGDQSALFASGQHLAIAGSTGNDNEYNVTDVNYNIGTDQTEVTVFEAIAEATVDGRLLSGPGQFELFERMPFEIQLGDEYIVSAGCDLSKAMCKFKFRNIYNRQAEDEVVGTDVALLVPQSPV